MNLKPGELDIPENEPFKNDKLKREHNANILTKFISAINEPYVMALDSSWGGGKTTFVKMWQKQLENQGFKTIYFNGWENDFCDDPLPALISEIGGIVENEKPAQEKAIKEFKKHGAKFIKRAIPVALKIITQGVIDINEDAEKELAKLIGSSSAELIEDYSKQKDAMVELRKSLSEFIKSVRDEDENSTKPVVFFIDELDRCRPLYAIEVLERVKHLFSVEGLVFVLSIDVKQLGHSLKCVYGQGMDVNGYLSRFIDLYYRLPEPSRKEYFEYLFSVMGLDRMFEEKSSQYSAWLLRMYNERNELLEMLVYLGEKFSLSLREIEKCVGRVKCFYMSFDTDKLIHSGFLAILIFLKIFRESDYKIYLSGFDLFNELERTISDSTIYSVRLKQNNKRSKHLNITSILTIEKKVDEGISKDSWEGWVVTSHETGRIHNDQLPHFRNIARLICEEDMLAGRAITKYLDMTEGFSAGEEKA